MPALLRARRRLRPGLADHPGRARRRPLRRQRAEGVDELRPHRQVGDPARPHRPDGHQAHGDQLLRLPHGCAGDRDPAAHRHDGRARLQRGLLHRRAHPGRPPRRARARRVGAGQGHARQRAGLARRARARCGGWARRPTTWWLWSGPPAARRDPIHAGRLVVGLDRGPDPAGAAPADGLGRPGRAGAGRRGLGPQGHRRRPRPARHGSRPGPGRAARHAGRHGPGRRLGPGRGRGRATPPGPGASCSPRPSPSAAAPPRSSATSWPKRCSVCREIPDPATVTPSAAGMPRPDALAATSTVATAVASDVPTGQSPGGSGGLSCGRCFGPVRWRWSAWRRPAACGPGRPAAVPRRGGCGRAAAHTPAERRRLRRHRPGPLPRADHRQGTRCRGWARCSAASATPRRCPSSNWAGYADTNDTYTSVSLVVDRADGQLLEQQRRTEPRLGRPDGSSMRSSGARVRPRPSGSASTATPRRAWSRSARTRTATRARRRYYAWYEMYPNPSVHAADRQYPVQPG